MTFLTRPSSPARLLINMLIVVTFWVFLKSVLREEQLRISPGLKPGIKQFFPPFFVGRRADTPVSRVPPASGCGRSAGARGAVRPRAPTLVLRRARFLNCLCLLKSVVLCEEISSRRTFLNVTVFISIQVCGSPSLPGQ